jgi:hypothetical protein
MQLSDNVTRNTPCSWKKACLLKREISQWSVRPHFLPRLISSKTWRRVVRKAVSTFWRNRLLATAGCHVTADRLTVVGTSPSHTHTLTHTITLYTHSKDTHTHTTPSHTLHTHSHTTHTHQYTPHSTHTQTHSTLTLHTPHTHHTHTLSLHTLKTHSHTRAPFSPLTFPLPTTP